VGREDLVEQLVHVVFPIIDLNFARKLEKNKLT